MPESARTCLICGRDLAATVDWVRHCPKCAGVSEGSQERFLSEKGYFLEFAEPKPAEYYEHFVGGPNEVPGAVCNGHGCNRPFIRLLTLDLRDPKLSFIPSVTREGGGGPAAQQFPLFYCWVCGGWPTYRLEPSGHVEIIGRSSTGPEEDFPYPDYPRDFPARRAVLKPVPPNVQRIIRQANAGTLESDLRFDSKYEPYLIPHHQVGGVPYLVQGVHECGSCPRCGGLMSVLATAASDSGGERPFVDNSFVQVVFEYCPPCQVVSATHECD